MILKTDGKAAIEFSSAIESNDVLYWREGVMKSIIKYSIEARLLRFALSFVLLFVSELLSLGQEEILSDKLLYSIRLGDSSTEIAKKINLLFVSVQTNRYLPRHPFRELLPYTNNAAISEWQTKEVARDDWPEIVFAIFSDEQKTNLVDALWFSSQNIRPLVNGLYNRNLVAIKSGDSVQKLYALVGRRECKYYLKPGGKWQVRFFYWGFDGRMIVIEADAATGLVLKNSDSTI